MGLSKCYLQCVIQSVSWNHTMHGAIPQYKSKKCYLEWEIECFSIIQSQSHYGSGYYTTVWKWKIWTIILVFLPGICYTLVMETWHIDIHQSMKSCLAGLGLQQADALKKWKYYSSFYKKKMMSIALWCWFELLSQQW